MKTSFKIVIFSLTPALALNALTLLAGESRSGEIIDWDVVSSVCVFGQFGQVELRSKPQFEA